VSGSSLNRGNDAEETAQTRRADMPDKPPKTPQIKPPTFCLKEKEKERKSVIEDIISLLGSY
jgi:hypothetical protein